LSALATITCGGGDLVLPTAIAAAVRAVSGDGQTGFRGQPLADSLVVEVTDSAGNTLAGAVVAFRPVSEAPGALLSPDTSTTGADGRARARWVLGDATGRQVVEARIVGEAVSENLEVRFTATAMGGTSGPPLVVSDDYDTIEGFNHTLTVSAAAGVLRNDGDPDGDPLTASKVTDPRSGSVTLLEDGSFTYTPVASFFGDDRFDYRATDADGNSNTATVRIHVAPVNDRPRFRDAGDQRVRRGAGPRTVSGWATGISPGADNEAGQVLEFETTSDNPELFSPDGQPAVVRQGATRGRLSYQPAGQTGTAIVTVVLRDDGGTANGGQDTSEPHVFRITVTD
jgi:hypothetical protein